MKITELMREYTDEEFNIEGENAADTEKVLKSVMVQVKPKKKVKPLVKALIAAAAAVCVAGGTVAAASILTSGRFTTAAGRDIEFEIHDEGWTSSGTLEGLDTVVTLEDGRLYFNINGKSTDITYLVDRQTPYVYSYTIGETGEPAYIIAGGTPEDYGVVDMYHIDGIGWEGHGAINGDVLGSNVRVNVDDPSDQYLKYSGWYYTNLDLFITYDTMVPAIGEYGEEYVWGDIHWHGGISDILPTWQEDRDAWLIEGLLQLGLIELPDPANFVEPEIYVDDDGNMFLDRGTNGVINLTEKISEDVFYIDSHVESDFQEHYIVIGGTPDDYGWAVISRYDDEYWFIGGENITDADGQLRGWYVNAVEKKGFDLEQLQQNHYFDND